MQNMYLFWLHLSQRWKREIIFTYIIMDNMFGVPSVTRPGDMDYTTKKGDKVYHRRHHYVRKTHKPYGFHKGSRSKTHKGRKDFTTKKGSKVFHRKGHYVRKSYKPYTRRNVTRKTRPSRKH